MPAKIVSGPSTTGNSTTQTSDVHHNAVPAGATVLGSSGVKPTTANGMPLPAQGWFAAPIYGGITELKLKAASPPAAFNLTFV